MIQDVTENLPEWTEEEYTFGKLLLERKHPVLRQFLERELRIRTGISEQLAGLRDDRALLRKAEVEKEIRMILHARKKWGIE